LSDEVTVDGGYDSDHGILFRGYVKKIEKMIPDKTYKITVHDPLIRAVDMFLASDDPEAPLTFNSISDYDLVNAMLGEAGLPNVVSAPPFPQFVFGTNADGAKFNLQSVADVLQFIASITGRLIYADNAGDIYYVDRKPYVDGDSPTLTFVGGNGGNIIDSSYEKANDKIRSRVVCYGKTPIKATAEAPSPYTVVTQTAVIAHELIDLQSLAESVASINLTLLNRLQETYSVTVEGSHNIQARKVASLTEPYLGASGRSVYLYRVSHTIGEAGFVTSCTCIP